jgi:hypothetical protein
MKRQFNMSRKKIVFWVMMLMGFSLSSAWAYEPITPFSGGTPVSNNPADYRFQSTSPLLDNTPSVQDADMSVTYGANYGPLRGGLDDPGVGEVEDPVPVGEPLCLLFMAAAYYLFCRRKRKTAA